jgi:putative flippase GtrA
MRFLPVPVSPAHRWIAFNSVGAIGFAVQMGVLFLLVSIAGWHYLPATALAVEAAVLHNFIWHEKWTWADRAMANRKDRFRRLAYFHLANGIVSVAGNVLLMRFFVGTLEMHYLSANVIAIALCAVLNFLAGDRLVFQSVGDPSRVEDKQ